MSGNFYVSPESSSAGSEHLSPVNLKPILNEKLLNIASNRRGFPNGIFSKRNNRNTLNSKQWGNTPFFTNAKPTSMLERGLLRSRGKLKSGQKGLLTQKDGPEFKVEVAEVSHKAYPKTGYIYSFIGDNNTMIKLNDNDRFEEWDFYYYTKPVPFVPKKGGKKTRRLRRKA
jgi:hypothetical protein